LRSNATSSVATAISIAKKHVKKKWTLYKEHFLTRRI
jgi:hypothetical protein